MELKLGKVIKRLMKERRLSVKELSKSSGVAVSTLHEWLNGRSPRDPVQVKKVAETLRVSMDEILFDQSQAPSSTIDLSTLLREDVFSGIFEINVKRVKVKE